MAYIEVEFEKGWLNDVLKENEIRCKLEELIAAKKYFKRSLVKVESLIKEYEEKESKL